MLRHTCSGKMVCPENGGTRNGVRIVVSSTCTLEDSNLKELQVRNKEGRHVFLTKNE